MHQSNLPEISANDLAILPLERSETIPSAWYTDTRFHEFDRKAIFSACWQLAGHADRLRQPGDFLSTEVAGNPVILVCGKDNQVRAFFNVCRHRGGPLAIEESGSCHALQCNYHGWTYTLEGMLRGVPQFDRVELFDKKDFGLIPIELASWEGLLFVRLSPERTIVPGVQELFKGIRERIAPERLSTKRFYKRVRYPVECNWKVYVDNYLEGYHLPYVHPELCNLLDYHQYVTETFEYTSLQYSPLTGDTIYAPKEANGGKEQGGSAFYYFIFPNMMLNILPGRLQTNIVIPRAANKAEVIFDYYYDEPQSGERPQSREADIEYSDRVQDEDAEICAHVQKGLESVAYDKGRFSVEMEKGVYHFQSLLKESYRKARAS